MAWIIMKSAGGDKTSFTAVHTVGELGHTYGFASCYADQITCALRLVRNLAENPYSLTPNQWASEAREVIKLTEGVIK